MDLKKEYEGKNVLITGGGGFIGSNLAIKLVNSGANVSIMDSRLQPYGFNLFNLNPIFDKINLDYSDIRNKKAIEKNILEKDIIFNLAAQVGEKGGEENPFLDWDINVRGHKEFLETCLEKNPDARVIFSGSRLQYGKTNGVEIISESHSMNPITNYAKNKLIGEGMYEEFDSRGLSTVRFRITNPFGPRASISNPGYCIVNWFIGRAINGQDIPIYGEGLQARDYIFIDDLTEAFAISGVHKNAAGKTYNVGSGEKTLFKDMAEKIVDLSGNEQTQLKFIEWPHDAKNRETGNFIADISKIKKELEWSPRYSLEEGLKETLKYYRNYGKYYERKN